MESLHNIIQLVLEFLKAPFLFLHFSLFLLYINDLPNSVICNIILYSKCDQASELWQQLESASELESDLRKTVNWGRKSLVDFNAGKT